MWPGVLVGLLVPAVIFAGNAVLPFTFTSGSPIRASEMNANFEALRAAINLGNSGTRLKYLTWRSPDGARLPVGGAYGFWDSQLRVECRPRFYGAAGLTGGRCLPIGQLDFFADPNCVQRATFPDGPIAFVLNETQDAGLSHDFAAADDGGVYRLGPVQSGQIYRQNRQGLPDGGFSISCVPEFGAPLQSYRLATVPVPITDFAEVQWVIE